MQTIHWYIFFEFFLYLDSLWFKKKSKLFVAFKNSTFWSRYLKELTMETAKCIKCSVRDSALGPAEYNGG